MKTKLTSIDAGMKRRKSVLESKLEELLSLSAGREELEIQQMADPLDQVRSITDRDMAVETLNHQARSIHEIRDALLRIESGAYGLCERCEEPIASKRLDALPSARLCINCQSDVETEQRNEPTLLHSAA